MWSGCAAEPAGSAELGLAPPGGRKAGFSRQGEDRGVVGVLSLDGGGEDSPARLMGGTAAVGRMHDDGLVRPM